MLVEIGHIELVPVRMTILIQIAIRVPKKVWINAQRVEINFLS